jgi:hypothetical protein
LLLPIPERLNNLADLEWPDFASYIEIENLLPESFLIENNYVSKRKYPGGEFLEVKKDVKTKLWKKLIDLDSNQFTDFNLLFNKIDIFVNG